MSIFLHMKKNDGLLYSIKDSLQNLNRRHLHRHEFRIISCYLDFSAIKKLIETVSLEVKLTDVSFLFERMEIYRNRRPNEALKEILKIERWCQNNGINFSYYAVRVGALMHAKGYSVIQWKGGKISDGIVWISSGNATQPGLSLRTKRSNIEISASIQGEYICNEFISQFDKLTHYHNDIEDASIIEDEYQFKYALLSAGVFLHEWKSSLSSQLGIRYHLTDEGQKAIVNSPYFKNKGFSIEQATINKNPISKMMDLSKFRSLPKGFSRKYTIESMLGRWCPLDIWLNVQHAVESESDFKLFYDEFNRSTEDRILENMITEEKEIELELISMNYINQNDMRMRDWKERIQSLREDEDRLSRYFMKYIQFDMPYEYHMKDHVEEVYQSLTQTMDLTKKNYLVTKKASEAINNSDLDYLELSDIEKKKLYEEIYSSSIIID